MPGLHKPEYLNVQKIRHSYVKNNQHDYFEIENAEREIAVWFSINEIHKYNKS